MDAVIMPRTAPAFSAASAAFSPGTTPQDIFTITGSATKTIEVLRMTISSIQTAAGTNSWFIAKRSTANSGGTSAAVTAVPHDSNDAAATATVLQYTANPTAGTLVGNIWTGKQHSPTAATIGLPVMLVDFTLLYGKPIILTGITEVLAWNFAGASLPSGLSCHCVVTWIER